MAVVGAVDMTTRRIPASLIRTPSENDRDEMLAVNIAALT